MVQTACSSRATVAATIVTRPTRHLLRLELQRRWILWNGESKASFSWTWDALSMLPDCRSRRVANSSDSHGQSKACKFLYLFRSINMWELNAWHGSYLIEGNRRASRRYPKDFSCHSSDPRCLPLVHILPDTISNWRWCSPLQGIWFLRLLLLEVI